MIRPRDVVLTHEEAARFDEDERANLRSWGIGVPEPVISPPDEDDPITPCVIHLGYTPPPTIAQTWTAVANQSYLWPSSQTAQWASTVYMSHGATNPAYISAVDYARYKGDWRIK